jgi:hypothetical protein
MGNQSKPSLLETVRIIQIIQNDAKPETLRRGKPINKPSKENRK